MLDQATKALNLFDENDLTPEGEAHPGNFDIERMESFYGGSVKAIFPSPASEDNATVPIIYVIIEVDDPDVAMGPINLLDVDVDRSFPDHIEIPVFVASEKLRNQLRAKAQFRYQNEHGDNSFWEDSNHSDRFDPSIAEYDSWQELQRQRENYVRSKSEQFRAFDESMTDSLGILYVIGKEMSPLGYAKDVLITSNYDGAQSTLDRTLSGIGVIGSWTGFATMGSIGRGGKTGLIGMETSGTKNILNSSDYSDLVDGLKIHDATEATQRLKNLANQEYGISVDLKVIDPADWEFPGNAGFKAISKGRIVVRIKNGPLDKISGTMRHEMTHVLQEIYHPTLSRLATSDLTPGSSLVRFALELEAHNVHTFARTPLRGALREMTSHRLQLGSDIFYVVVVGGGTSYVFLSGE